MAKTSVRNRNAKRVKAELKFRTLRTELRNVISDMSVSPDKRALAVEKMQSLPRDSSRSRKRNRCKICGRPRSYNRLTGLCRLHMRLAMINGMVPGMRKSSW